MAGPSWLNDFLAAIMIVTAVYCAGRLVIAAARHRATEHDVDLVHVVMGVAMAGMLVPRINPGWSSGWAVLFGAATAWFGWRAFRGYRSASADRFRPAHHVPHLVMSGAMVYMLVAVSKSGAGSGPAGRVAAMGGAAGSVARFPIAALVLALFMIGYVMWVADRLPALATVRAYLAVPELAAGLPAAVGLGAADQVAAGLDDSAGRAGHDFTATPIAADTSIAAAEARTARPARTGRTARRPAAPLSPRLAACCEIVMGIIMGYMLILML